MCGREEQDLQRENWIKEKLKEQPQILSDYMISANKMTSSTRKAYLGYLIDFFNFMDDQGIKITEALPMHIDRYVNHISETCGESLANAKLSAIMSFYKFLVKNKFIIESPCSAEQKYKIKPNETVIYMTDEEVNSLKHKNYRKKHTVRDNCIITLGVATGLRVSAIRNIDIEDIDFEKKTIHVIEKGPKERDILIGDNTMRSIKCWMIERERIFGNNTGPLFMSQKKNRLSVRTIQEMIHDASEGVDKHITPHKMRSTCAMKLYNNTGDIYITADQLGHSNLSNTKKYAKANENRLRQAVDILD